MVIPNHEALLLAPVTKRSPSISSFLDPVCRQAQLWGALANSSLVMSALGRAIPEVVQWVFWVLGLALLIVTAIGYAFKVRE